MENSFNINFWKTCLEWLPTFLRGNFFTAITAVLTSPVDVFYNQFLSERKRNILRIKSTAQKFSLQKRLNDEFDALDRRIRIEKAVLFDGVFLYTEGEDDPSRSKTQWLYVDEKPIYLFTEAELNSDIDFIVKVPPGINQLRLRAEIEYYMLQSKQYVIEII